MPQRSTDDVQPEHTRSLQCQLCQCVELLPNGCGLDDRLPYFREGLFHDTCTTCPPTKLSLEPLCSFCNHLRLPHLFGCVTPEIENLPASHQMHGIATKWGKSFTALLEDQDCPLCAIISSILRRRTTEMDQDDGNNFDDSFWVFFFRPMDRYAPWELSIELPVSVLRGDLHGVVEMSVAKDGGGKETYPEPLFGPDVNWELVRQWVWKCHQDHPSQKMPFDTTDKDFRLIDVMSNCLVRASKMWSYAALSYVWGDVGAGEAQAVQANVSQLQEKGLLLHKLPKCITDALTVCRNLGINFLWVDRLCIVQDDEQSKHGQIKQMGSIYASAIVTIVAAAGKDAGHGLVGVSQPRSFAQAQQKLLLQGIKFTERLRAGHFYESIQQSAWRSRGWTFQEEKLSTALLLFSEYGVSFQCKHRPYQMDIEGLTKSDVRTHSNTSYPSVVSEYSQRKLSFGSDILNAFSGYLGTEFNDQHYFGLPCAYFTQALLWKSADNSGLPRKSNGNETFPSWSWASKAGAIDYPSWLVPGDHQPVASWAAIVFPPGRTPQLFPVCEMPSKLPSLKNLLERDEIWTYWRKKPAWRRYLFKQRLLTPIPHGELSQFWTTVQRQVESYIGIWFQNKWLSMKHNLFTNVTTGLEPREVFLAGRLMAYTQIAKVSVTRILWRPPVTLQRNAPFVLRNKLGKWIGFVDPEKFTAERINSYSLRGETYSAECLALFLHREKDSTYPLYLDEDLDILLDRVEKPGDDMKSPDIVRKRIHRFWREMGCLEHQISEAKRQSPPLLFGDRGDPDFGHPPQLTVMMVERTESVARRVGVGIVYFKRWRESAPKFQSVLLE